MRELLTRLSDALFPPSHHTLVLRGVTDASFDQSYEPRSHDGVIVLSRYVHPELQAAIHENKFNHSQRAARLLARHLDRWLKTRDAVLLVPVPLGPARERTRGHNQVTSIVSLTQARSAKSTLRRARETPPQSHLPRGERLQNVAEAFVFGRLPDLSDVREIVIIDDVMTTGATLKEARATLAPHLPPQIRLTLLALAH